VNRGDGDDQVEDLFEHEIVADLVMPHRRAPEPTPSIADPNGADTYETLGGRLRYA